MEDNDNPYTILGVPRDATQQQIKSAYRKLALKHHPDKQSTDEDRKEATVVFAKISNAYEILGDPVQRENYDRDAHARVNRPRSKQPRHTQSHAEDYFHHTQFHDPFSVFEAVFRDEFGADFFGGLHGNHRRQSNNNFNRRTARSPFDDPFFSGGGFGHDPFFGGGGMAADPFFGGGFGGGSMFAAMNQQMNQMMNMHQNMMMGGHSLQLPNQGTSFVSYSSTNMGGGGGGRGQSVSTSTTTRIINGKRQTVTERVVQNADGTVERHVDLTGDEDFPGMQQQQLQDDRASRPALEAPRQDSKRRSHKSKQKSPPSSHESPPKESSNGRRSSKGKKMRDLFKRKRADSSKLEP
jgi:curved DNA-binding protein CbpA